MSKRLTVAELAQTVNQQGEALSQILSLLQGQQSDSGEPAKSEEKLQPSLPSVKRCDGRTSRPRFLMHAHITFKRAELAMTITPRVTVACTF